MSGKYKLNLFVGDSLELDIEKVFGVKKFDIVIGNPPYNASSEKIGDSTPIYNLFIENYL